MDTIFNITKAFEKDLNKFNKQEKNRIKNKINYLASIYNNDEKDFYSKIQKIKDVELHNNLDPSLYIYRISNNLRLLFSVDEDPLFDQVFVNLYRVVQHSKFNNAYKSIKESLYQEFLEEKRNDINGSS
jgi:mRNA-degrading endonuclease RelE of RelBE toxin-antitoxin system